MSRIDCLILDEEICEIYDKFHSEISKCPYKLGRKAFFIKRLLALEDIRNLLNEFKQKHENLELMLNEKFEISVDVHVLFLKIKSVYNKTKRRIKNSDKI